MPNMEEKEVNSEFSMYMKAAEEREDQREEDVISRAKKNAEKGGVTFTEDYERFMVEFFVRRRNMLLTGKAGTGKSTLLKTCVFPEMQYEGLNFAVCASTGVTAAPLQGRTLHSWLGIGLGPRFGQGPHDNVMALRPEEVAKIHADALRDWDNSSSRFMGVRKRVSAAEVIVIDEISMIGGTALLDYVDLVLRELGDPDRPFGGKQMLFCGDFLQIPPVTKGHLGSTSDWAFKCRSWKEASVLPLLLRKIYRQSDPDYVSLLNHIRDGRALEREHKQYLQQFVDKQAYLTDAEKVRMTYLVATNREADLINSRHRTLLPPPPDPSAMRPVGDINLAAKWRILPGHKRWASESDIKRKIKDATIVREDLILRIGSPVLITKNGPPGTYVNGTKGTLEGVVGVGSDGEVSLITVSYVDHLGDKQTVSLGRAAFTRGGHEPADMMEVDPEDSEGKRLVYKYPRMEQFPVIAGHAITSHKAQGMTLDECYIALPNAFAPGQVYVALSRLRSPSGLTLGTVDMPVRADPDAVQFYKDIDAQDGAGC